MFLRATNSQGQQIIMEKQTKLSYQGGQMGGVDWGLGISLSILKHMEQLGNGDLLYITENSTHYSVIICVGKESERNGCVCMYDGITVVQQMSSQPCKWTILR